MAVFLIHLIGILLFSFTQVLLSAMFTCRFKLTLLSLRETICKIYIKIFSCYIAWVFSERLFKAVAFNFIFLCRREGKSPGVKDSIL